MSLPFLPFWLHHLERSILALISLTRSSASALIWPVLVKPHWGAQYEPWLMVLLLASHSRGWRKACVQLNPVLPLLLYMCIISPLSLRSTKVVSPKSLNFSLYLISFGRIVTMRTARCWTFSRASLSSIDQWLQAWQQYSSFGLTYVLYICIQVTRPGWKTLHLFYIRHKDFLLRTPSSSSVLLLCHARTTPPDFWNGLDWRALVED